MSALTNRLHDYVPRHPMDDVRLTGFLISSVLVALFYLILWGANPSGIETYDTAVGSVGLLLLSVGFFGFLVLRALALIAPTAQVPSPGLHAPESRLLVYSASFALTAAVLAALGLGAELAGATVVWILLDLFATLFAWAIVYLHVAHFGADRSHVLELLTIPRWRAAT